MKRLSFAAIVVAAVAGCGDGSHSNVSYTLVTEATHDCAQAPNASIEISDAAITLTGTCDRILVKGGSNKLTIEAAKRIDVDGVQNVIEVAAADLIRVDGVGNTIKYTKKGVTKDRPAVEALGDNNTLIQSD